MKIFKYQLPTVKGPFTLPIPEGFAYENLYVGIQNNAPYIWFRVYKAKNAERYTKKFQCFETGYSVDENEGDLLYLGTALLGGGAYVLHYFEDFGD